MKKVLLRNVFPIITVILAALLLTSLLSLNTSAESNVIFIKDGGTGDGSTDEGLKPTTGNFDPGESSPARQKDTAFYQAVSKLMDLGGGTIVVCGKVTFDVTTGQSNNTSIKDVMWDLSQYKKNVNITYTSVYNGVDYRQTNDAKLLLNETAMIIFPTGSTFRDITIAAGATERYLNGGGNPMNFLSGTNFTPVSESRKSDPAYYVGICGGERYRKATQSPVITVDIGNENVIGPIFAGKNAVAGSDYAMTGDTSLILKSGTFIGNVCGASQASGALIDGNVSIDVSGGIYKGAINAVGNGGILSGNKTATVRVTDGDFDECAGIYAASLGIVGGNPASFARLDLSSLDESEGRALKAVSDGFDEVVLQSGTYSGKNESGNVIYIADGGNGDGSSPKSPLKAEEGTSPLWEAADLLKQTGGTIVVCGKVTLDGTNTVPDGKGENDLILPEHGDRRINVTSFFGGVDYRETNRAQLILVSPANLTVGGFTVFRHIDIVTQNVTATTFSSNRVIAAGGHRLWFDVGVRTYAVTPFGFEIYNPDFTLYPSVCGGSRASDAEGNAEIVIKSGTYHEIAAGPYGCGDQGSALFTGDSSLHIYDGVFPGLISGTSLDHPTEKGRGGSVDGNVSITLEGGLFYDRVVSSSAAGFASADSVFSVTLKGGTFLYEGGKAVTSASDTGNLFGYAPKAVIDCDKKELEKVFDAAEFDSSGESGRVIFISDNGTGDGSSPDQPLKAETVTGKTSSTTNRYRNGVLYQAVEKLSQTGGTIVLVGDVKLDYSLGSGTSVVNLYFILPKYQKPITITSVYNGVDYRTKGSAKLIIQNPINVTLGGETVFENLDLCTMEWAIPGNFETTSSDAKYRGTTQNSTRVIGADGHKLTMGEGIRSFVLNAEGRDVTASMTSSSRYLSLAAAHRYKNSTFDTDLTVLSGTYNRICGGTFGTTTAKYGITSGNLHLTIGGTTTAYYVHGTTYCKSGDNGDGTHTGSVSVTITGGTFLTEIDLIGQNGLTSPNEPCRLTITGGDFSKAKIRAIPDTHFNNVPAHAILDMTAFDGLNEAVYNKIGGFESMLLPQSLLNADSISSMPAVTEYCEGDLFSARGMTVSATLFGKSVPIPYSDGDPAFTFSPDSPLRKTDTEVTVFHKGKEIGKIPVTVGDERALSVLGAMIKTNKEKQGLRFVGRIAKEKIEAHPGASYGFLLLPSSLLSPSDTLSFETINGMAVLDCTGKELPSYLSVPNNPKGDLLFDAVFDSLTIQEYKTDYTVVAFLAYAENDRMNTEYSFPITRSVYGIALAAIASGQENEAECRWLKLNVIDKADAEVNGLYQINTASVNAKSVLDYMQKMADVVWTPSKLIDFSNHSSVTGSVKYEPGKIYHGLPYTEAAANYEMFADRLVGTKYPVSDAETYYTLPGNVCSSAPYTGWERIGNSLTAVPSTEIMLPAVNKGFYAVGEYEWEGIADKPTIDIITASGEDTNDGLTAIYRAYSSLMPGDMVVSRWESGNSILGHIRLVAEEPKIVYYANGKINPDRSTVKLTEQTSGVSNSPYGKTENWYTNWRVNLEWSFSSLANSATGSAKYIPVTIEEFRDGFFEKPFAVCKNFSTGEEIGKGLKGTVVSNYNVPGLSYEIKDSSGKVIVSENVFYHSKRQIDLSGLLPAETFTSLPAGTYSFRLTGTVAGMERLFCEIEFTK